MKNVFAVLLVLTTPVIGRYWSFDFNSTNPFIHQNEGGNTFNCTREGDTSRCNLFRVDVLSDANGPYWDIAQCFRSSSRCFFKQSAPSDGVIDSAPLFEFADAFEVELILFVRTPMGIAGPFLGFWQNFGYKYPQGYVLSYNPPSQTGPGTNRRFSLQFLGNSTHQMFVMSEGTICSHTRINEVHAVATTGPMRLRISVAPDTGRVSFRLSALNNPMVVNTSNYTFPECPSIRTEASTLHWYSGMGDQFRLYRWWTAETADLPLVMSTTETTTMPTTTTTVTTTKAATTRTPTPAPTLPPTPIPTPKSTTTSSTSTQSTQSTTTSTSRENSISLSTTTANSVASATTSAQLTFTIPTGPGSPSPSPFTVSATASATASATSILADSNSENSAEAFPSTQTPTTTDSSTTSTDTETIDLRSGEVDDELPWWWWIPLVAGLALCLLCLLVGAAVVARRRRRHREQAEAASSGTYTLQRLSADEMSSARFDPDPVDHGVHYARFGFDNPPTGVYDNAVQRTSNGNYNYDAGGGVVNMVVYSEAPSASTPSNNSAASFRR